MSTIQKKLRFALCHMTLTFFLKKIRQNKLHAYSFYKCATCLQIGTRNNPYLHNFLHVNLFHYHMSTAKTFADKLIYLMLEILDH